MAHSISRKMRGMLTAFVALVATLLLVPGTAFAANAEFNFQGNITISGDVTTENSISVYKVASIMRDDTTNESKIVVNSDGTDNLAGAITTWSNGASATNAEAIESNLGGIQPMTGITWTNVQGGVQSSNVSCGIYLIKIADSGSTIYQTMVVAVSPHRDDTSGQWALDPASGKVNVKSTDSTLEKTIVSVKGESGVTAGDDGIYETGDTVVFNAKFHVGANLTSFTLTDTIGNGLQYVDNTLSVYAAPNTTALTPGTDYTVNPGVDSLSGVQTFTITFKASGLQKCSAEGAAPYIQYSATITNAATVLNPASNTVTSSLDGDGSNATLHFAGIQVMKTIKGSETPLAGAKFGLYTDEDCTNKIAEDTTGSDGTITFNVRLDPRKTYWVKEISAPDGFKLVTEPTQVNGTGASYTLTNDKYTEVPFEDEKAGIPEGVGLPTTGGMGTVAFTAAGVVIIAGAAAFLVKSRKNND